MRPQLSLLRIMAVVLLMCSVASTEQFSSPLKFQAKMREALRFDSSESMNTQTVNENSLSVLSSYVAQLSYGDLVALPQLTNQGFPEEQMMCQQAIAHGSIFYVRRWIAATEQGMTPEDANRFAARQLQDVAFSCNVPVVANASGFKMPSAGGPCATSVDQGYVDSKALQACLQQTLEFWTSYLYVPSN